MSTSLSVNPQLISWAIARAGFDMERFAEENPRVQAWLTGEKQPTRAQLEDFSRKVWLPFGFLMLDEPPQESMPIPFFRSQVSDQHQVSIHVMDSIRLLQHRQNWLRDRLMELGEAPLPFVGKFRGNWDVRAIVQDIRTVLDMPENWAASFPTFEKAMSHLVSVMEDRGIIVTFNGVVENNTHRKIAVEECRGFVLVDDMAPFMFVNNSDAKSAQLFTLIHELAHIWVGHSAGFDLLRMLPASDPVERLCDQVAAEFLVPKAIFLERWAPGIDLTPLARHFKVSKIVIARRALDTGMWTRKQFFAYYETYRKREFVKKERSAGGGDFYATARRRISPTFAARVRAAVDAGELLHRDAYRLTGLNGDTFEKFFTTQARE
jgi:Zn-dependent peptidase ImmA (M78 family)